MDKNTLKFFIIECRDSKGYSYRKISELLKNQYGKKLSRQAVYGYYKRTKEKELKQKNVILMQNLWIL